MIEAEQVFVQLGFSFQYTFKSLASLDREADLRQFDFPRIFPLKLLCEFP